MEMDSSLEDSVFGKEKWMEMECDETGGLVGSLLWTDIGDLGVLMVDFFASHRVHGERPRRSDQVSLMWSA